MAPKDQKQQRGTNPEVYEARPDYHAPIVTGDQEPPKGPEALGEQREAEQMRVRGESARSRADVAITSLRERAESRNYDPETAELIKNLDWNGDPEKQIPNLTAMRSVSIILLSLVLRKFPDFEQESDLNDFGNVGKIADCAATLNPIGTESNAINKLREAQTNMQGRTTLAFRSQWENIVKAARQIRQDIHSLETADFKRDNPPDKKDEGFFSKTFNLIKTHPIISFGIALIGAYGIYKLVQKLSPAPQTSPDGKTDVKTESSGFWKWALGIGGAILTLLGLGRALEVDGVKKFFKDKLDWDVDASTTAKVIALISHGKFKEAWEAAWEGVDANSEKHAEIAKIISAETHREVSGRTIFELKDKKFESFISWLSAKGDEWSISAGDTLGVVGRPFLDSRQENEEQIAVRIFLKKHKTLIRGKKIFVLRDETTVGEVLEKLCAYLKQQSLPPEQRHPAAAAGAAALLAGNENSPARSPGEKPEVGEIDQAIERLPQAEKEVAIELEKFFAQKISFGEIEIMQREIDKREQVLERLLQRNLEPAKRAAAEKKLAELRNQKLQMQAFVSNHKTAYLAYLQALQNNPGKLIIQERAANLAAAKEHIEDLNDEIFEREGWTVLTAIASTHALRIVTFAHRRWMKADSLRIDNANVLFDRFKETLKPTNLRKAFNRLRTKAIKPKNLKAIRKGTDQLFQNIDDAIAGWEKQAPGATKKLWSREHFEKLDALERVAADQHRELDRLWKSTTQKFQEAVKAGNTKRADALRKYLAQIGDEKVRIEFHQMKNFGDWFSRWQEAFRGDPTNPIYKQGINKLRMYFREALRTRISADRATAAAIPRATKAFVKYGRMTFLTGSIILGGETLADDKTSRPAAYAQAGLGAVPVVGTYLDFYSAIMGKEKITGRKLDVSDRAISALFGGIGILTDALSVFGIGLAGRAALTGLKAGVGLSKAARVAKAVEAIKTAKSAARAGKAAKTFEVLEAARKWGFRVSLPATFGVGAYMAYSAVAELPVSDEFQREIIEKAEFAEEVIEGGIKTARIKTQPKIEPEAPSEGAGQAETG